ncbi:MAG TPA: nitrilase-related carbon-nitrogen hydrolase [Clostridia bacterium]|nr:nitrilase-related carbon-nitrogen hydrolase [Clostridia bacterium]
MFGHKKKSIIVFVIILCILITNSGISNICMADAIPTTGTFKAAAVQFNPQLNERDKNIDALVAVVTEAAQEGAKLIVTPEMATTGYYYPDRKAIEPFVDTIPGITTRRFEEVARQNDVYIVIGMPELDKETGLFYNSAALVGPEGYIGKYRKTHQWETEEHWAAWGDLGVPVYDTKLGKIAINICMDSAYFETARLAAVNGADILTFPTNSSAQAISALQARAVQNGLYIVSANRSNTENGFHMIGASAVWSPKGEKLAEAAFVLNKDEDINEPTILYADIDPALYKNDSKERLKERRPELYKDLMLYVAPWDYTKTVEDREVTAVSLQYEPVIGKKQENMDKIKKLVADARKEAKEKGKKIDLFVLPEMSVTGPISDSKAIGESAEELTGVTVNFFKEIAKENAAYIVFGMIEKEAGNLYNTAVLIDQEGGIAGSYRQTHLNSNDVKWAKAGDEIKVFSTNIGKIGVMLGYDAVFPEVAGLMAVKRADIIAIPARWNGSLDRKIEINRSISANRYPEGTWCIWDSIAMSAQAYTIVSNFIGTENGYIGNSALYALDPLYGLDQPVAASKDKEEALMVHFNTVQSKWWFNQEYLIHSRRTFFYKPLILGK